MILLLVWVIFIFSLGLTRELDQSHYFILSGSMLYFIYLYHQFYHVKISLRTSVCLLTFPSIIFWYIAFVYNSFLCLTPINHEVLVSIIFFYIYIMLYTFWECP